MKDFVSQKTGINIPVEDNEILKLVLERVNSNTELSTLWRVSNVNAMNRLGYGDHGYTHFQIVANCALRIFRILVKHGVEMSLVKDYDLKNEYSEVVIFLASVMHDLGMSINRQDHEMLGLFIANNLLRGILDFLTIEERTIVISEVLHAILSHRSDGDPITVEAGILRVADALDMANGRSRIPFESGKVNIHSVSAYAIENVNIKEGKDKPVQICILMNNSSGLYQIDELLKKKLRNSGISDFFEITAFMKGKVEKSLIKDFKIEI